MQDIPNKKCTVCNKHFPFTEFHKNKNGKYGVESRCKPCKKEYSKPINRNYYLKHRDEFIEKSKRRGEVIKNSESIKCDMCPGKYKGDQRSRHYRTKMHIKALEDVKQ